MGGAAKQHAPRVLGLLPAWALVAGSMLGVGIYLSPPVVARHVGDLGAFLGLWAAGGLFAFAGAVAYAELGAMMPEAGGDYVFHRRAFGPAVAFASGWVLFAAIFCGSIAAMSVGLWSFQLSTLTGVALGDRPWLPGVSVAQAGAVGLVVLLTAVNAAGARISGRAQAVLTVLSVGLVLGLASYGLLRGGAAPPPADAPPPPPSLGGLAAAYMAVYFAYAGWNNVTYVAGEVRDPDRNVPRALMGGVVTISGVYLLVLAVFVAVLGMAALRATGDAGAAAAERLGGLPARLVLAALVAGAIVASINATVCAGARILWAMARDGAFWPGAARLGRRTGAPARALWLQAAWSVVLVLSGSFERLLEMASLAMILTGGLTVAALFVLRRRLPDAPRPYRATGYPWLPALFLVSGAAAATGMIDRAVRGEPGAWYPLIGLAVLVAAYAARALRLRIAPR